jgi:hypothetical protein
MTPLITSVEPIQVTIQTDQVLHVTGLYLCAVNQTAAKVL